jgi:hypothetical protein
MYLFSLFFDVLVHLEEDNFERLLLLKQVEDLEVLLVETSFCLIHHWLNHVVAFLVYANCSAETIQAEDEAEELLESPSYFQEKYEDNFGVGAFKS